MRVYIPHTEEKDRLYYPDDTMKIVKYLESHGELKIKPKTVEDFYFEFSETRSAGWLYTDDENLESFAEWLSEIDI